VFQPIESIPLRSYTLPPSSSGRPTAQHLLLAYDQGWPNATATDWELEDWMKISLNKAAKQVLRTAA